MGTKNTGTPDARDYMIENGMSCDQLHMQDEEIEEKENETKENEKTEKIKKLEFRIEQLEIELTLYREWKEIVMKSVPCIRE